MWSTEVGGHVHRKNRLVSSRQHRATEVQKLCFHFFPVNILTGVVRWLLGLHDTLLCVLLDIRAAPILVSVLVSGRYCCFHEVLESVIILLQIPILITCENKIMFVCTCSFY